MFSLMTTNWKTTVSGIVAFLSTFFTQLYYAIDSNPETVADANLVIVTFMVMVGLLRARDDNKSTEDNLRALQRRDQRRRRF